MSEPQAYVPELQGNPESSDEPAAQKPPADPAEPPECAVDGDCILTTFNGCCECCSCTMQPYAAVREEIEERMAICAVKECYDEQCAAVDCPPCPLDFPEDGAACRDGKCVVRDDQ